MIETAELIEIIVVIGIIFFIVGVLLGPWLIHLFKRNISVIIGPKYLIYRGQKTFKKMDKKEG